MAQAKENDTPLLDAPFIQASNSRVPLSSFPDGPLHLCVDSRA